VTDSSDNESAITHQFGIAVENRTRSTLASTEETGTFSAHEALTGIPGGLGEHEYTLVNITI